MSPTTVRHERTEQERIDDERIVRRFCGDSQFEYIDSGWTSRVYLVGNGATVFKFPRDTAARRESRNEVAALRVCEGFTASARTPRVLALGPDDSFVVTRGVVGETLDTRLFDLDKTALASLGSALGTFLTRLHACELDGTAAMDLAAEMREFHEKFELARPTLEMHFAVTEMSTIREFVFEEYPMALRALDGEPRLCHGDLGPWNMILTPTGELGIIDFGDVSYRDPSIDFAGVRNATLVSSALDAYGADSRFRASVDMRSRAFQVADVPFYVGLGNAAGLAACLQSVRESIVQRPAS